MDTAQIGDEFERLVSSGEMVWRRARPEELPPFARLTVHHMLDPYGVGWELGTTSVGTAVCLRLSDPRLRYLDVYPETEQFMWCLEGHRESVHPDEALIHLVRRANPGIAVELGRNGSILVDNKVVLEDLRRRR